MAVVRPFDKMTLDQLILPLICTSHKEFLKKREGKKDGGRGKEGGKDGRREMRE